MSEEIQTRKLPAEHHTRHGFEEKEGGENRDSMIISSSSGVVATGRTKIDLRRSSNSNIGNETNNAKTTHSKMLRAQNKHELSKTISLAEKEVKESNVIKVTRNEIKPCGNNEIKLDVARLDYLVEKQEDDKEKRRRGRTEEMTTHFFIDYNNLFIVIHFGFAVMTSTSME